MAGDNMAVLCIGANNNATENIMLAIEKLESLVTIIKVSDIYSTPAVGGGSTKYNNVVMKCASNISFDDLNAAFKKLEIAAGRDLHCREKGIVPLDIDIVIWNGEVVREWDFSQSFFKIGFSTL